MANIQDLWMRIEVLKGLEHLPSTPEFDGLKRRLYSELQQLANSYGRTATSKTPPTAYVPYSEPSTSAKPEEYK